MSLQSSSTQTSSIPPPPPPSSSSSSSSTPPPTTRQHHHTPSPVTSVRVVQTHQRSYAKASLPVPLLVSSSARSPVSPSYLLAPSFSGAAEETMMLKPAAHLENEDHDATSAFSAKPVFSPDTAHQAYRRTTTTSLTARTSQHDPTGVNPSSPLGSSHDGSNSRRHSKPLVYDQRLNPSALFANQEANGSRVSIQDQQDYSRPLGVTNPDLRHSFDSR